MEGVQYLQQPQLITLPIALPGAKPGDPQPTVQIQVLTPNMLQQPQPKYQMQIPIQGFQQGGAVLTVAYSPETSEAGGIQVLGNALPDGLQVLAALPQEMQLVQQQLQDNKEQIQQNIQHQVFITPNQQIVINGPDEAKLNNNSSLNNNNAGVTNIIIKEECDDNDDESSQGTESSENMQWQISSSQQDLLKYLNQFQPQQQQTLPVSLQQFLRINPAAECKKETMKTAAGETVEIEVLPMEVAKEEPLAEALIGEDGSLRIQPKKKKKYKKKAPRPARPKPGQVLIASAADGSPLFCCPQCQMAYPEKEQLECHLSVHDIERRFICGICGAGLKRKEHLERHKLGHNPERPYVCGVCRKGFKRREHLNLHTVIHSGVKTEVCPECGKGFYRKDHLRKHTRSHESKRARDDAAPAAAPAPRTNLLPEITIHVPTGANMQPVQINIPQHVVSSLQAAQAAPQQLDALLAQAGHS